MVFLMILAGILVAAILQELVLDRVRLRRGRSSTRPGTSVGVAGRPDSRG